MNIESIRKQLSSSAKDIKINLGNLFEPDNFSDITASQVYGIALACAYACKNKSLVSAIVHDAKDIMGDEELHAAKVAANLMAMNNVYYRFIHLVSDKQYATMPAGLRMQALANPGIDKASFELYCLAVSAINGCGMCMDSHVQQIVKSGLTKQAVQYSIRIAAVIAAANQASLIEAMSE